MARSNGSPQKSTPGRDEPSAAQLAAIAVLATGGTVVAAAQAARVERSVIYKRWYKDPAFVAALNAAKRDQAEEFAARRREAVQTLQDLMKPDAPPKYRLAAAKAVLEVCGHPEPDSYGPTTPEGVRRQWEQAERNRAESILNGREMAALTRMGHFTDAAWEAEVQKTLAELRRAETVQDQDA